MLKSGIYDFVICRGGTDMCFVPGCGWTHLDLEQYRISGHTLCAKTQDVKVVEELKKEIRLILCNLEKVFPPALFNVMMHLPIHLLKEALLRGHVHYC